MTRSITTAESYYRLKRIGYIRPDFSFSEFMRVAHDTNPASLPFTLTPAATAAFEAQRP